MKTPKEKLSREHMSNSFAAAYFLGEKPGKYLFTVYTKDHTCKRGEYAEEIDVACQNNSLGEARRVAQAAIDADYEPELRISRIEKIW